MTREELKEHCEKQIENCEMWARCIGEEPHGKIYEEHKLILELLEQEPCEDATSRQAVKEQMLKYGFLAPDMTVTEFVEELPSVNPQEPTEWQQDHEILKAYSDGANEMLDKIIVEIEQVAEEESKFNIKGARGLKHALKIIKKYREMEEDIENDL